MKRKSKSFDTRLWRKRIEAAINRDDHGAIKKLVATFDLAEFKKQCETVAARCDLRDLQELEIALALWVKLGGNSPGFSLDDFHKDMSRTFRRGFSELAHELVNEALKSQPEAFDCKTWLKQVKDARNRKDKKALKQLVRSFDPEAFRKQAPALRKQSDGKSNIALQVLSLYWLYGREDPKVKATPFFRRIHASIVRACEEGERRRDNARSVEP